MVSDAYEVLVNLVAREHTHPTTFSRLVAVKIGAGDIVGNDYILLLSDKNF